MDLLHWLGMAGKRAVIRRNLGSKLLQMQFTTAEVAARCGE